MQTIKKDIDAIARNGYDIVIVECWNAQGGQVYGAYIRKGDKTEYLGGGYWCRPDSTRYWESLCEIADRIANRM